MRLPVDASVKHSSHSFSSLGGVSSHMTLTRPPRGHFEHERQKCQISAFGSARYSVLASVGFIARSPSLHFASYLAGEREQSKHASNEEQKYGINHFQNYFLSTVHSPLTVPASQSPSF